MTPDDPGIRRPAPLPALCRDCLAGFELSATGASRCPKCRSPRIVAHAELNELVIAHIDCDAFYASVEKRDRPELADKPVIVGGGKRGVVSTCCYIARTHGVHSAMPMFKALEACPEAVVLRPDMAKYRSVSARIHDRLMALTPLVEPLSLDEAFLDLSGTGRLHHHSPATTLAALARQIEAELGITISVGLSHNKFLAKIASDLMKPRGFAVIGRTETLEFLKSQPVSLIWGVGTAMTARLARDGITTIGQLQTMDEAGLTRRYGVMGQRLARLARGHDSRRVVVDSPAKSISAERTFETDIGSYESLEKALWPLCEQVSRQLKKAGLGATTVTLKLKTRDFRLLSRSLTLDAPTQLAETLFHHGRHLLRREASGTAFRLLGIGTSGFRSAAEADPPDLIDPMRAKRAGAERAIDQVREKFGAKVISKGHGL